MQWIVEIGNDATTLIEHSSEAALIYLMNKFWARHFNIFLSLNASSAFSSDVWHSFSLFLSSSFGATKST